ncbi:apoptosis-inducing TAF9-like domain 1 family protein [Penicillium angulare]|uniref:apoptosis-inducing TAF9-like domain 1 family protein n=1 Tax=Penicillium angulare TaxID=116970 RepID=UPI00254066A0|nr:apoptosis-inducing TAF9-like domain 1 family protein [Penicillium angulare]KAJ5256822.1 apoptosis-inducing TAF9-like domain 1 family protein [Penicillium angulare]
MSQTDQGLDKNEVERLKTALCDSIVKIVQEETLKLEATATPQFVNALLEVAWSHLETTIADVEAFSRHAGRSTITPADVLMLCRRNEGLNQTLRSYQEHLEIERQENS